MRLSGVPSATSAARTGVTVRLDPEAHEHLHGIAKFEHRSVAACLEMLVEREIARRDEADRVIRVHVAPELKGQAQGEIIREAGESAASDARRSATIKTLFGEC